MKALYISGLPRNPELRPTPGNPTTVLGVGVFAWNALCALLTYGTYDKYLVPGFTERQKNQLITDGLTPDNANRLVPVPVENKSLGSESDDLVLATMGPELRTLATLRHRLHRHDLPICGFIHSINSARVVFNILQQYFAGLDECDLLFCSSRAGMKTIEVYLEEIDRLLPNDIRYRARRVLVPLGVRIPTVDPTGRFALRQRLGLAPTKTIALFFGRLSQMSKADLGPLLLALSVLSRRGTIFHLVLAGDDTQAKEAPRLAALAADLGCHMNLTVWVNTSPEDKHLLYSAADIFVSPSDNIQETFGLAVAEALAYGMPAIVSDWSGYRDLVADGKTGYLIRSFFPADVDRLQLGDCTSSMLEEDLLAQSTTIDFMELCEKLEKLVLDSALRTQMGRAGRQFAENHLGWRVIVNRYEELWHESCQMVKGACRSGIGRSRVLSISLEKSFGHFASAKRNSESDCFVTAEGREWLRRPDRFYFLSPLYAPISPQYFSDLLRIIDEHPGIPIRRVVDSCSDAFPISVNEIHWTVERLFKYGLLMSGEDRLRDRLRVESQSTHAEVTKP